MTTHCPKCKDIVVAMGLADKITTEDVAADLLIAEIRRMNKVMHIPEKLSGVKAADISKLAKYADKEVNPLYPVPMLMDVKRLEQLVHIFFKIRTK